MSVKKEIKITLEARGVAQRLEKISTGLSRVERNQKSLDQTLDRSMRTVAAFAFQMERLARSFGSVRLQASKPIPAPRATGGGRGGGGRSGGTQSPFPKSGKFFSDPNAIISAYGPAATAGDPYAAQVVNKAKSQLNAQQRAAKAFQGTTPYGNLNQAMQRTRFARGLGGKMMGMPLGRDITSVGSSLGQYGLDMLFGSGSAGGAEVGAVAAPALAAAAALTLLVGSAKSLDNRLKDIASGQAYGGGSQADAGIVNRLEDRYPGVKAAAKRDLTGDPTAAAEAAKAGLSPVTGPYGDRDYNKRAERIMRYISEADTYGEARRRAEAIGLPPEAANAQKLTSAQKKGLFEPSVTDSSQSTSRSIQRGERVRQFGQGFKDMFDYWGNVGTGIVDWLLTNHSPGAAGGGSWGGSPKPVEADSKKASQKLDEIAKNTAKTADAVSQIWMPGSYGGDSRMNRLPDRVPRFAMSQAQMDAIRANAL